MGTKRGITEGQHNFATIPRAEIQRSQFNRSSGVKTTFDSGDLIPIFCDEALPGDTFTLKASVFARISTLIFPLMDNVYLDLFFFAVPNRLLWDNWERFNGAQDDPGDSTEFLVPHIIAQPTTGYNNSNIHTYMGIPSGVPLLKHSALWSRAYNQIWNQWFRDENLQDSLTKLTDDGPDAYTSYSIQRRGKRHDYFTSCLPFPQKATAVALPLGTSAPVVAIGDKVPRFDVDDVISTDLRVLGSETFVRSSSAPTATDAYSWNDPKLEADLSSATAATINAIREAFQIQRLYERDARGGTRYTELLQAHFGVSSPDQRMQRPEYLGGGTFPVLLTPVAQTNDNGAAALADLGAYGVASGTGAGFTKSFVEHCTILGLVASRADLNYQQGLNRQFSRFSRFEFYWPALAHLGEQAVLNKEIFADATANDELVFGYQERFAEYRYKPSLITGELKSNSVAPLDPWHLAQDFVGLPVLDATFIQENPPMDRVVAVPTEPHFIFDAFFDLKCARPMPTYSVPGMIDHF